VLSVSIQKPRPGPADKLHQEVYVGCGGAGVDDAGAQDEAAVQGGAGEECLAADTWSP
jgi:hypothetical protein